MSKNLNEDTLNKIRFTAKQFFINSLPTHDWSHVNRVLQMCKRIGIKENADLQILELAALLHDIARQEEDTNKGKINHAERGAELAENILHQNGIEEDIITQVTHCILSHRFRNRKLAKSIEAKVLFDADNMDAMGAIGIARSFSFAGENKLKLYSKEHLAISNATPAGINYKNHTPILEFKSKLLKLKDAMQTKTGKEIAENRHQYMIEFLKQISLEIEGSL